MLDLYANLQSGTQRQHQTEFCMFIEAVLSLPLLFRVLIRRMEIAHGGLRGCRVRRCLLAAAAPS